MYFFCLSIVFHSFGYGANAIVITTIGKVDQNCLEKHIEELMKKPLEEIEKVLPRKAKLIVFCGYHGKVQEDPNMSNLPSVFATMGKSYPKFFNDVRNTLLDYEEHEKIKEMEIENLSGRVFQISLLAGKELVPSVKSVTNTAFKDLQSGDQPTVICLLSCFSQFSDFKEFLQESGVCAVAALKNDLGIITKGQ